MDTNEITNKKEKNPKKNERQKKIWKMKKKTFVLSQMKYNLWYCTKYTNFVRASFFLLFRFCRYVHWWWLWLSNITLWTCLKHITNFEFISNEMQKKLNVQSCLDCPKSEILQTNSLNLDEIYFYSSSIFRRFETFIGKTHVRCSNVNNDNWNGRGTNP